MRSNCRHGGGSTGRVAPDEGGDIRIQFGANSYEGWGGAIVEDVVFVLIYGVTELAEA